jgi:hypothetical protein
MYLNGDGSFAAAPYYPTEIGQATATAEESAVPSEVTNAWTNWSRVNFI